MSFFLDTRETSQRFGTRIEEFCSLLDTNHMRHGAPDDLFEFAGKLERNDLFRLDLSALVKSVVQQEHGELLLTDMMSIITAAVGGPSFADTHVDLTRPTNTLMEFLMGTGCWRHFGSPPPLTSSRTGLPPSAPVRAEEPRPNRTIPTSPVPKATVDPADRASLLDASSELRQTLTRLEINTLQVKLHLESIEQRISRIEPSPDIVLAQASSSLEPLLHTDTAKAVADQISKSPIEGRPAIEGPPLFLAEPSTQTRAVFSHQPPHAQPLQSETEDDFSSPTFTYGTEKERNFIGVFLVLAAIVVALILFARSGPGQTLLKAGMSRIETILFSSVTKTDMNTPAATLPSTPAPASASTAVTQNRMGSTPMRSAPAGTNSGTAPDAQTIPGSLRGRYVPANVMEGRLISAPRPEYPPGARASHIEGTVAMQATISRSGSIKTLHVIQGPQALRSAAISAVRNWRYKPYSVDGRSVEVATTIYVDFSLKPPPAIAHEGR